MSQRQQEMLQLDSWLSERLRLGDLVTRLKTLADEVEQAELASAGAARELKQAEAELVAARADVAFIVNGSPDLKNAESRKAALAKALRTDAEVLSAQALVDQRSTAADQAAAALNRATNHQKNCRVIGELYAARLRAISP